MQIMIHLNEYKYEFLNIQEYSFKNMKNETERNKLLWCFAIYYKMETKRFPSAAVP